MDFNFLKEMEGKKIHDHTIMPVTIWVPGPIIVGAGPSGLAVAACLKQQGIPSLLLERANCLASLWQLKTYDRLRLHLPKQFCELPLMPFPPDYPTYPTKQQFVSYLDSYARTFGLQPEYNTNVVNAEMDIGSGLWRVRVTGSKMGEAGYREFVGRWLIVATGENAEEVWPNIEGLDQFVGPVVHTSLYKSGYGFKGKRVLVVGCGNSGMEVCLDLCNYNAQPSIVVRDSVSILFICFVIMLFFIIIFVYLLIINMSVKVQYLFLTTYFGK